MTKVTGRHKRLLVLVVAIITALAISACGGSSGWSAAQKQKLRDELGSELSVPKASGALKDDANAIKDCVANKLIAKYSPNSHPSTKAVTAVLDDTCGAELKKFEHALQVAEAKSEKKTITSGSSSG
jgi:hypothetical protein